MTVGLYALRPIACVAGLNSTVQGLVGIALGVLALCVSFCAWGSAPKQIDNDFSQYLTYYFQGGGCGATVDYGLYTGVTSPPALKIWLVLSLFFNFVMLISSVFLVVAVAKHWSEERLQVTLVSWIFTTVFTEIYDVVFGCIIGTDFFTYQASGGSKDNVGPLTLGFLFFLALRGGYLWLLNLAFLVYLFRSARALHKYLNEEIKSREQDPIESWPTVDDNNDIKGQNVLAVNSPRLGERGESSGQGRYPEHTARARWPFLFGPVQQGMRYTRTQRPPVAHEVREVKTTRETRVQRQEGVDNQAFEPENRYYLRLHNEVGSSQDFDDSPAPRSQQWEYPREHLGHGSREVSDGVVSGHYKRMEALKSIYEENGGISIPPVDYLDDPVGSSSPRTSARILSLQEAILDRTLRLKKVPEELKRGIQKY